MQRNDCALDALETALAKTGQRNDLFLEWLLANGATTANYNDAQLEFLVAQGYTTGHRNDRWFAFLGDAGYTGALADRFSQWYCAGMPVSGGGAAAFDALTFDPDTYEMLGVKTGTGDLTAVSSSTHYAPDHLGVYQQFAANTPVYSGGRCVLIGGAGSLVDKVYADDGTGTLLPEVPYLQYYPAATNDALYSNDATNWTNLACAISRTLVGLDGTANTGNQVSGTGTVNDHVILPANQTPTTRVTSAATIRMSESTSVDCLFDLGASSYIRFNPSTGAYTTSALLEDYEIIINGDLLTVIIQVLSSVATDLDIFPNRSGTLTDSVAVLQVGRHLDKTIAEVRGLGPIFTTTAAVATTATYYTFDLANQDNTNGALYLEYSLSVIKGENGANYNLYGYLTSAFNLLSTRLISDRVATKGGATASYTSIGMFAAPNQPNKMGVSYLLSSGDIGINGGRVEPWTDTTGYTGFNIGSELTMAYAVMPYAARFRNLQRYDITSYQEGKDIIDGKMA